MLDRWYKLIDTNNYSALIIKGYVLYDTLKEAYFKIMDQYRAERGEDYDSQKYLQLIIDLELAEIDLALGDKFQQNIVNMRKMDIEEIKNKKQYSRNEELAAITRHMGVRIDPKTTTLADYCGYMKDLKRNGNT